MLNAANLEKDGFFLYLVKSDQLRITTDGVITNTKTGRELGYYDTTGAKKISWHKPNVVDLWWRMLVNRLVWLAFNGPLLDSSQIVVHVDGNKRNNKLANLALSTQAENCQRTMRRGANRIAGEYNAQATFNQTQVINLRQQFVAKEVTLHQIVAIYGCRQSTARNMIHGVTYQELPHAVSKTPRVGAQSFPQTKDCD